MAIEYVERESTGDETLSTEPGCTHHWLIEPPNGPESFGQCRNCGERRSFTNNPDAVPLRTNDHDQRKYALRTA
jgi:hypothetical protein